VTALALALTGCVAKSDLASAIPVKITDDGCAVATPTATAGAVTFSLANTGSDVNEFEILAEDQLRIVGEKENVTPGPGGRVRRPARPGHLLHRVQVPAGRRADRTRRVHRDRRGLCGVGR
jgi:hypothetical protein